MSRHVLSTSRTAVLGEGEVHAQPLTPPPASVFSRDAHHVERRWAHCLPHRRATLASCGGRAEVRPFRRGSQLLRRQEKHRCLVRGLSCPTIVDGPHVYPRQQQHVAAL